MKCEDLTTDSVPDPPREVINDEEEGPSSLFSQNSIDEGKRRVSEGYSSQTSTEERKNSTTDTEKEYLKPPQEPKFSTKKKPSPRSSPKFPKTSKEKKKSPEPSVINKYHISHSNGVHFGPVINLNVDKSSSSNKAQPVPRQSKTVKALLCSKTTVKTEHIRIVNSHIGENWRDVGRNLNMTDGMLSQIKLDFIDEGMKEVVYQVLLKWTQIEGSAAILGDLTSALWDSAEYSAVKVLAEWMKENDKVGADTKFEK